MNVFSELTRKMVLACALGPLAVIPAVVLYELCFNFSSNRSYATIHDMAILYLFIGIPIAYIAVIFVGVPITLILSRVGRLNLINLLTIAVLVSTLVMPTSNQPIYSWLFAAYCSVSVVLGCWFVQARVEK